MASYDVIASLHLERGYFCNCASIIATRFVQLYKKSRNLIEVGKSLIYEVKLDFMKLHTPLQESSKTADDGESAPREWCGCSGCMVHSGRRHGAHGRRAFPLFGNTFALAHGFTLDLDGVGVVDDPVTDGVGQGGVVQVLVPLAGVVLGAEDGGGHLAPGLY